ncbi:hypothetical protein J3R83DRAFT_3928 [Lanmaoa asiatica]|nr:hypothetical protein J3R83DRAFT_3928 [Lanmaoa asiatica]
MTFSFRPTVVADIFDNLHSTYIREQISDEEIDHTVVDNYPPSRLPLYNHIDLAYTYPIYSARVTAPNGVQAQSFAFRDFPNDSPPYLSGYTPVGPVANSVESVLGLADGGPPPYSGYARYPPLYQATETMFKAPLPPPSGIPYCSDPLAHSQVIRDPSHIDVVQSTTVPLYSTSSVVQPRNHPAIHLGYQASTATSPANDEALLPFPTPTVPAVSEASVVAPLNTVHTCQCSSACNAVLSGSAREVRRHLIQEHQFRGAAKESILCLWAGCKRILQRENIPRHITTCHIRVKSRESVFREGPDFCFPAMFDRLQRIQSLLIETMSTPAGMVRFSQSSLITPLDTATTPGWASHTI